jgi:O-antigen/teichoic acid export membrane protein
VSVGSPNGQPTIAVWGRIRGHAADPLFRSAYSLMLNAGVTAGLGIAFWVVAARLYEADEVGRDAALIAAMVELSTICQLNLTNALTRFLPSLERGTARALAVAYAASGGAALLVGSVFVVVAPLVSEDLDFLHDDPGTAVLYVVAQVTWGWFVLQDAALTALRRAPWIPVENGIFGALKLGALPIAIALGESHGVFLSWVLPAIVLLLPVNLFLFRTAIPAHVSRYRPKGSSLRRLGRRRLVRFMGQDWGATVLAQASTTALPLLVVALLGSAANAYFYIPFTIVVAFNMVFYAASTSLVVEGSMAEERIHVLTAKLARHLVLVLFAGTAVIVAAAPLIMLPFGADYVHEGTSVLRILACACVFRGISILYIAVARLHGQGLRILVVEALQMALLLGGAITLADPLGLEGIALAWLGSIAIVAVAVLPSLVRLFRSAPPRAAPTEGARTSSEEILMP